MFEKVLKTPLEYTIILKVSNKDRKLVFLSGLVIFSFAKTALLSDFPALFFSFQNFSQTDLDDYFMLHGFNCPYSFGNDKY